jgi:hypothetical protein
LLPAHVAVEVRKKENLSGSLMVITAGFWLQTNKAEGLLFETWKPCVTQVNEPITSNLAAAICIVSSQNKCWDEHCSPER